jgi:Domain of unknown function (DUF1905)/Bacteriocin-protection, YdeI or OmpD-Associated
VVQFQAKIVEADRGGAFVAVPPQAVEALGGGGRIPVRATFDGVPYQGSVVSMGGQKVIGLLKSIRAALGKGPGDAVVVTLQADRAERVVTVPDDLRAALDAAGLAERFAALSYSHQREQVNWIDGAKRPETRARRITQAIDRIRGAT